MNLWLAASFVALVGFIPCLWVVRCVAISGSALAGLSVASVLAVVMLMTLTVAFARPPFIELARRARPAGDARLSDVCAIPGAADDESCVTY